MTVDVHIERRDLRAGSKSRPPALAAFLRDAELRALVGRCPDLAWAGEPGAGGIEQAIEHFAHVHSPPTVLVDLIGVREPLAAIDQLADVCLPGTRVVAVGEVNDIQLYRRLRDAGVAEYLVKPVTEEQLSAALLPAGREGAAADSAPPIAGSGPIVVVGARGGVGATLVAVSLAWLAAEAGRQRTVLVDLDLGGGTAALALDVEPGRGLAEALATPDRIDSLLLASATAKVSRHLAVLASELPLERRQSLGEGALALLVGGLRQNFERVVCDLPRSDPALLCQSFESAGAIVIVTDFTLAAMRDSVRLAMLAAKLAPAVPCLVVGNRWGAAKAGVLSREDCENALGSPMAAVIHEDRALVQQALGTGKPLPELAAGSQAAQALRALAEAVGCVPASARAGWKDRLLTLDWSGRGRS